MNVKPNIRLMAVTIRPDGGGAEASVRMTLPSLHELGVETYWTACSPPILSENAMNAGVLNSRLTGARSIGSASIRLRKLIRQQRPNILHVHCERPELVAAIALLLVKKQNRPHVVVTEHTRMPWVFSPRLGKHVRWLLRRLGAHFISCFSSNGNPPMGYEAVIRNPIELPSTRVSSASRVSRVLVVGRLVSNKNVRTVLEAVARVDHSLPVLVIGDGGERTSLEIFATKELDNCTFLGFQRDPWSYVQPGDILVSASAFEGDPLTITEALVRGVPVIGSSIDAHLDLLSEGATFADGRGLENLLSEVLRGKRALEEFRLPEAQAALVLSERQPQSVAKTWARYYATLVENSRE